MFPSIMPLCAIWYLASWFHPNSSHILLQKSQGGKKGFEIYYHQTDYLLAFLTWVPSRNSEMKPVFRMGQPEISRS